MFPYCKDCFRFSFLAYMTIYIQQTYWLIDYLAQSLILDRYYFHPRVFICVSACVCLSVCLEVLITIFSNRQVLMKLSRMIYYDKRQVPFKGELNRAIRTEVRDNFSVFVHKISVFSQQKIGNLVRLGVSLFIYDPSQLKDHQRL